MAPQYGGAACSSVVAEHRECFLAQCSDCDDASHGPNGQPCFNDGACVDKVAFDKSFTCSCAAGFTGSNCQMRMWPGVV